MTHSCYKARLQLTEKKKLLLVRCKSKVFLTEIEKIGGESERKEKISIVFFSFCFGTTLVGAMLQFLVCGYTNAEIITDRERRSRGVTHSLTITIERREKGEGETLD